MTDLTAVTEFRNDVLSWWSTSKSGNVKLFENNSPANDQSDDYNVVYEAIFLSENLYRMQIGVVLTDNLMVGIALDSQERMAKRLNWNTISSKIGAGREPGPLASSEVKNILSACRYGLIAFEVKHDFINGIQSSAYFTGDEENFNDLFRQNSYWNWLKSPNAYATLPRDQILDYEPW